MIATLLRPAGTAYRSRTAVAHNLTLVLLLGDAFYLVLHLLTEGGLLHNWNFLVTTDGGFAEHYQYTKYLLAAGCLLLLFTGSRAPARLLLGLLFLYLFADDAGRIHDRATDWLGASFSPGALGPLAEGDFLQLLFMLVVGGGFLLAIGFSLWLERDSQLRGRVGLVFAALVAFGAFAVGTDAVHAAVGESTFGRWLGLVEDTGEMVCISLAVGVVLDDFAAGSRVGEGAGPREQRKLPEATPKKHHGA